MNLKYFFGLTFLVLATLPLASCAETEGTVKNILNFEDCVKAGHPVDASSGNLPRKCTLPGGLIFFEAPKTGEKHCKDLCGNGTCEEIVCEAVGCPCAETQETCPQDCK